MTPDDFVRSLTPSGELQPVDCLLDQFRKIRTSQVSIQFIVRNRFFFEFYDASREIGRRSPISVPEFPIPRFRPGTPGFYPRCLLTKHEGHGRKLGRPRLRTETKD